MSSSMEEMLRNLAGRDKTEIISIICQLISCFGLNQSDLHGNTLPISGPGCQNLTDGNQGVANVPPASENSFRDSDHESVHSSSSSVLKKRRISEDFPPLPDVSTNKVDEWIKKDKQPKKAKRLQKKVVLDDIRDEENKYYSESEVSSRSVTRSQAREVATSLSSENMDTSPAIQADSVSDNSEQTVRTIQDQEPGPSAPRKQKNQPPTKKVKIPPIVVRQKDKWVKLIKTAAEEKINFSKAVNLHNGIKVQPSTPDDYRRLSRLLVTENIPHHTYSLPEDRQIRAVFRGLPEHFSVDDIREELEARGFDPSSVTRMKRANKPLPMVLLLVTKDQKDIFEIKDLLNVKVQVEPSTPKLRWVSVIAASALATAKEIAWLSQYASSAPAGTSPTPARKLGLTPQSAIIAKGHILQTIEAALSSLRLRSLEANQLKNHLPQADLRGLVVSRKGLVLPEQHPRVQTARQRLLLLNLCPHLRLRASDICAALEQMKQLFCKFPVLEKMFTVNNNVLTGTANV
ncbi:uncharacterized protein [Leptinotarsa decemlineata]|uniref:uncharacterized protein n=1 Tax=Leptinotarsa decemlineata TaxID=7539 RepID=UPI003D307CE5